MTLAELFVLIKGDDSHLEKSLDGAEKKTVSAGANIAKVLGGVIVGGATIAAGAILAIGGKAWDVASDIDGATDQIGASLGLTEDEAAKFGDVIKTVYGDNFGDSIADVGDAVEQVAKQLNLAATDPALPKLTANAFRLRDVFKVDVASSVNAVKTLMQNFGITSEKAFDMLAMGYQSGLDSSGDFLDTIGEYSVQFAEGGASAEEFFSLLDSGLQGGMLGTDKAADAFKEFRLRIQDGSTLTSDSLKAIGLNADEITSKLQSGSITIVDAWDLVQKGMIATEDPLARFNAGVGLIGSQFEDLGEKAILGIDITNDWAEGGIADIAEMDTKYTSLGGVIEGMWRKFEVGIAPAGEAMLGFVNENLPAIQGVVNSVSGSIVSVVGLIPVVIADMRKKWDGDWAGIRSTWDAFRTEVPNQQAKFWDEWNKTFNAGSDQNRITWEDFFRGLTGFMSSWWTLTVENWTLSLGLIRGEWQLFSSLFQGDWEGTWNGFKLTLFSVTDIILNYIEFVFGPGFRDAFAGALNGIWDTLNEWWDKLKGFWDSTIGTLPGMGKIGGSVDFGIVNPENTKSPSQQFLEDMRIGQPQSGSLGGTTNTRSVIVEAGGITITGVGTSPEGLAYLEEALIGILERAQ